MNIHCEKQKKFYSCNIYNMVKFSLVYDYFKKIMCMGAIPLMKPVFYNNWKLFEVKYGLIKKSHTLINTSKAMQLLLVQNNIKFD